MNVHLKIVEDSVKETSAQRTTSLRRPKQQTIRRLTNEDTDYDNRLREKTVTVGERPTDLSETSHAIVYSNSPAW